MASIFKPKGKAKYVILYTDDKGRRRKKAGATDKAVTQRIAAKLENDVALRKQGLIDPAAERFATHERRPIRTHLEDYRAALHAKGNTKKHVDLSVGRALRVISLAGPDRLNELDRDRVQGALAALRKELSLGTINHHRAAIQGFSRWLWKGGRLRDDPLVGVTGFNAREDRRHDRRTLGVDDLRRLIRAAERGPRYRRMTGPARALCYRLAVSSGLRYSEIRSLTPAAFDGESVTIAAGYAKNGQTATLPLPGDVASDLAAWIGGMPEDAPIFPLPGRGADMLKVDLEAAGLPYRDAAGLVFDFHSLRCQTATLADQAGCSPRVVQRMMRHSTLELTGRYTRPRAVDMEDAARSMPTLRPSSRERGMIEATGTDDAAGSPHESATSDRDELPNPLTNKLDASSGQRNHNPRVGGSNPSAATRVSPRQSPTVPAKVPRSQRLAIRCHVRILSL